MKCKECKIKESKNIFIHKIDNILLCNDCCNDYILRKHKKNKETSLVWISGLSMILFIITFFFLVIIFDEPNIDVNCRNEFFRVDLGFDNIIYANSLEEARVYAGGNPVEIREVCDTKKENSIYQNYKLNK